MSKLRGVIPWLRARRTGWTTASDRAFHDTLFASHDHDAFSPAYTGNITIRRFADLSEPFIEGCASVLDMGCGLGEITCELALRHPDVQFCGVDHSEAGVAVARKNAARLRASNVTFEQGDMESFAPTKRVDLVTMFDAFHHLLDPQAYIARMGKTTDRFLLIEPQGDWKGSWKRALDFDWLVQDLEKIRAHVAYAVAEPSPDADHEAHPGAAPNDPAHLDDGPLRDDAAVAREPVENRYSIEAFHQMFTGYGLKIRGTVSGIDEYPPQPTLESSTRREFGELGYLLYRSVDDRLYEAGLDLHAKHLVIHAEVGAESERRAPTRQLPGTSSGEELRGAYDVQYLEYEGPRQGQAGATFEARVRLRNRSFRVWSSDDPAHPDLASYHWLDANRNVVIEGGRSRLHTDLAPGESIEVAVEITAPAGDGDFTLAIDLVQEGNTWFHQAGGPTFEIPFRVVR